MNEKIKKMVYCVWQLNAGLYMRR